MIEVNFTIIIQMINFFIGFLLLKYLLFKPAAKYLQHEERRQEAISGKIQAQENNIQDKIEQKKLAWEKCEQYFKKSCPKIITKKSVIINDSQKEPSAIEISDKEAETLAKYAQKALLDRIDHVRK